MTTYATTIGERATVTLADGSRVILAPHSTLRVPRGFGRGTRDLSLDGEAYFDVSKASGAPFLIHTRAVVTRVLGTAFDVRSYPEDRNVRVVVERGKVGVGTPRQTSAVLVGGNMGIATDSTVIVAPVTDVTPYTGWTTGQLRFREVPLRDVLTTLERWYGVRFQVTDTTLAQSRLTAGLDFSSTADLVRTLEELLDVTATSSVTADGVVIRLETHRPAGRSGPSHNTLRREISTIPSEVGR
jgi:ferric-dicitrate binding protein FerR (iron transport regulator)